MGRGKKQVSSPVSYSTGDAEEAISVGCSLLFHQWVAVDTTNPLSIFPKVSTCPLGKTILAEAEKATSKRQEKTFEISQSSQNHPALSWLSQHVFVA